jgi:rhodanese-related sulfurtransferase
MKYTAIVSAGIFLLIAGCTWLLSGRGQCATATCVEEEEMELVQVRSDKQLKQVLVDVREPAEYLVNHVPGSINIPLSQIEQGQYGEIDFDANIILYCQTGNRAKKAEQILRQAGYIYIDNGGGINDL